MKTKRIWTLFSLMAACVLVSCPQTEDPVKSGAKSITSFSIDGLDGIIDEEAKTVSVTMPYGLSRASLVPVIAFSQKALVSPKSGMAQDFSAPQTYTVIAQDGSVAAYTVTVSIAPNNANAITGFMLDGIAGTIYEETKNISVTVPYGTDITALAPVITVPLEAAVSPEPETARDFSEPQTYTVTAGDGGLEIYTVTVTIAPNNAKSITGFVINGIDGIINEESKTIGVTVLYGTDITALAPVIDVSPEATISPPSGVARNFTSAKTYTVTGQYGSTADYTATVTVGPNSAKAITGFTINGATGVINEETKTIGVTVPYGTNVTALAPALAVSPEAAVSPASGAVRNFTNRNFYAVTAGDGTRAWYAVTVTIKPNTEKAITSFTINGFTGTINEAAKTISVIVPPAEDLSVPLVTAITVSPDASISPASGEPRSFATPQTYTVTAQDGTQADYTVTVSFADVETAYQPTTSSGLPVMSIDTAGRGITSTEVWLEGAAYTLRDPQGVLLESGLTDIKGRGNSTWVMMPKKPYSLKLTEKKPLLGMSSHKRWALLANYADKTLLRTEAAFKLGHILDKLAWTPLSQQADLYLNGQYQGVYQLTEAIKLDENRVNITEIKKGAPSGGYILEIDARKGEVFNFITTQGVIFCCSDPDDGLDKIINGDTRSLFEKIQEDVQAAEDALYSDNFTNTDTGYRHYLDVESFIDWYLVNEITKNNDAIFVTSVFMYYDPLKEKYCMGPLWDFDIALGNIDYHDSDNPSNFYIKNSKWIARLFEDPSFVSQVKTRWNQKKAELNGIPQFIDQRASYLAIAQTFNFRKWTILDKIVWPNPQINHSYYGEIAYMKSWFTARMNWLDTAINSL
jgi:hypothetical protein